MFKFNFGNENVSPEKEERRDVINWYDCKKVEIGSEMIEKLKNSKEEAETVNLNYEGDITLTCLSPSYIIANLKNKSGHTMSDILEAEKNHSDLIPGKYEGGLKVWECTRDLVNFIVNNVSESFLGKKVLDLGCGAGILGIVAALKGASVTFQDYNFEVIEMITIPNVFLNMKNNNEICNKTEFFSGDWASFLDCVTQNVVGDSFDKEKEPSLKKVKVSESKQKFDLILSSETIYNPDNYYKICRVIKELMKDDGVCYIAAKKCYFGVGGNIHCFTEYLNKENVFHTEICWSSDKGVAREILKIRFQNLDKYDNIRLDKNDGNKEEGLI